MVIESHTFQFAAIIIQTQTDINYMHIVGTSTGHCAIIVAIEKSLQLYKHADSLTVTTESTYMQ